MLPRLRVLMSISATLAISGVVEAVEMGNIEVQSAVNEPFRAKIPLNKISNDVDKLSVSTASDAEYNSLGMIQNSVKLNYRLQDNGNGTGTLWINSRQPVTEPFLDIVLNVTDNNQIQQHKVSALVNPKSLKSLKRKKLKTQNNSNELLAGQEVVIQPINSAPPLLSTSNALVNLPVTTQNPDNQNIDDLISQNHSNDSSRFKTKNNGTDRYSLPKKIETQQKTAQAEKIPSVTQTAPLTKPRPTNTQANKNSYKSTSAFPNFDDSIIDKITAQNNFQQPEQITKQKEKPNNTQVTKKLAKRTPKRKQNTAPSRKSNNNNSSQYSVVKRDTLWAIANKVSRKKNIPINKLMNDIVASNPNAFINNNPNKLKSGVTLVIPSFSASDTASKRKKPKYQQKRKTAVAAKKSSQVKKPVQSKSKNKTIDKKSKSLKSKPYQTKKPIKNTEKLKNSEMRIVAKKGQGKAQGEASSAMKKSKSKLPPQIVSQIKQSRNATIAKRKRINKLNTELRSFDQKLKVQNTKLAELEARLKQLQAKKSKKQ